jgi:hypothetical protein
MEKCYAVRMNHEGRQLCSVCESPILAEINAALDKGENLRSIAARSGISKATLSRHNRRCRDRYAVADYKSKRGNSDGCLLVVWPGQSIPADSQHDVLVVEYIQTPVHQFQNPMGLGPERLDEIHAMALEENEKFDAERANERERSEIKEPA